MGINYFFRTSGLIQLEFGKGKNLVINGSSAVDSTAAKDNLGITIMLDSLSVRKHEQDLEIKLWKENDTATKPSTHQQISTLQLVDHYDLEPMKIWQIEKTDLNFRLKAFYPNFEFSYTYPADRDTIPAIAPGITIELKTNEGTPTVTLPSDPPAKNVLKDIVGLGATLVFNWEITRDSIDAIYAQNDPSDNKIIFSGSDLKMYYLLNGTMEEKSFAENQFYTMPGQDSIGFKVLYCFPDMAYLKAVPSTKGDELLNPVAHLEIWQTGQGALDAFVYPETGARKGGSFAIPGSTYKIGLGTNTGLNAQYCDCRISLKNENSDHMESLVFSSGESKSYQGLQFRPVDCSDKYPRSLTMEVSKAINIVPIVFGFLFLGIALLLVLAKQKRQSV